ncbi:MAG: UbiH/UbiF/VisC/COQ6 family ubiquinone biosynthesis hydroxylase [Micavibrio aeruginosavorus]|uniref:UbiH/UbiF/VisC/COQ6 family ubiquinone biosynthesis hydroxylase n=1 Tax=Micavibrio aeruginosavorus TaxID=349221 RepID=A0A7T5UHI0_9BACT|nr:MAG: UbiH/UbiF/VisC/COQ6 family ubiquinone biosynthesis hydroxylase [Micavibrio aeruginosavorus]
MAPRHRKKQNPRSSKPPRRAPPEHNFDVIVIGGGLAGLTTTCLLANTGLQVACIDREPPPATLQDVFDGRTTAISWGSRKVLEAAGIWHLIDDEACPIRQIDILDGDSPLLLTFHSDEVGGRTFGWIAENLAIRKALYQRVAELKTAQHIAPATVRNFIVGEAQAACELTDGRSFSARLIIGADGRQSFTREWMGIGTRAWSYHQRALVCNVEHENPHDNIAVEHFYPGGPFATLPLFDSPQGHHRSSVVWTEHGPLKDSALHWDQDSFDAGMTARFPARYGRVRQIGKRYSYPLGLIHAHSYIGPRMALVADAAHGIHPIAGQGLNLGFRDIAELCDLIAEGAQQGADPGRPEMLAAYQRRRRLDNIGMAGATDSLTRLFSNDFTPVRLARRAGLRAVAEFPPAKRFFMKQAMGAAGLLPSLIKDHAA